MGVLLDKALTPAAMDRAWRYYRNDRGLWAGRLPVCDATHHLVRHMLTLVDEVRSGCYRAETMRCFEIPKPDGGKRLISSACVRDKVLQRAVLSALEPLAEARFFDSSYGFRPQCTLDMAHARVSERVRNGWVWLVDADIEKCFDAIGHRDVLRELNGWFDDRAVIGLIEQWLRAMPDGFRRYGRGRGLPQGMVLSPLLCNVHLHALDLTMRRHRIPIVRFADDFILFAKTEKEAERAQRIAAKSLRRLGLTLHPTKTQVTRSSKRLRFLGKRLPNSKPRFRP